MGSKAKRRRQGQRRQRRRKRRGGRPWDDLTDENWRGALLAGYDAPDLAHLRPYLSSWLDANADALSVEWARSFMKLQRYSARGRPDPVAFYDAALADAPQNAIVEYDIGHFCWDHSGDLLRAKSHLKRATELAPELAAIHYTLAQVYHLLGARSRARACFAEAIERAGEEENEVAARALFNLGVFHMNLGEHAEARAHVERALERMPDYPQARSVLMRLELTENPEGLMDRLRDFLGAP